MAKASKPAGKASAKKAMTKSQFVTELVDAAKKEGEDKIGKKHVEAILDRIIELIKKEVSTKGPGKFVFPDLCRITVTRKPAVKGGEKKINRLTGEEYVTKDKPAYNQVKLRPVKKLKDALA